MEDNQILANSMEQTIEYGNLEFLEGIGEILIDSVLDDGLLKEIPVLGSIVGVGKCIKNVYDLRFAKKLIAFLYSLKDTTSQERVEAIEKWKNDENYRGKIGDTLLGMIERCDDTLKAAWLSRLFYELVLKKNWARLFMRAEKTLSVLSVMDVIAFLHMPEDYYMRIPESECEPFIGSGLYQSPRIAGTKRDGMLDLEDKECEITEIGYLIYNTLKKFPIKVLNQTPLF